MKILTALSQKWKLIKTPVAGLRLLARVIHKLVLSVIMWIVRIENMEALAGLQYPVVFALNHNSYFETLFVPSILMAAAGRRISFFVHWAFAHLPFVGWGVRQIDPVYVYNRKTRFRSFLRFRPKTVSAAGEAAAEKIRRGSSLGIFPEGGRNHDPLVLNRGRLGLGELVLRTGVTVVPVGIDFPARQKRRRIPVLGRLIVRVGRPLPASRLLGGLDGDAPQPGLSEREKKIILHGRYQEISHRVMRTLAELCGKRYPY